VKNPHAILDELDAGQLAAKLRDLDGDRRALLILLRAARARERRKQKPVADGRRERAENASQEAACG
jgi:hypothetical protein